MISVSRAVSCFALLAVGMHLQPLPAMGLQKTVVYPTGVFPDDVVNVQAAVSKGGEVELEPVDATGALASFNFGPATSEGAYVNLPVDIFLHGNRVRGKMTTISGGNTPIIVYDPIHFTIAGLQFNQPADAAIFVLASKEAAIVDNVVNGVVGVDYGAGYTQGFGIGVNPGYSAYASDVTGQVLISRNIINGVRALQGYGLLTANVDAEVIIDDNEVKNVNLNGILVGGISENATVINNVVVTGAAQDPNFTAGNGILVGHALGGHFNIIGNRVQCVNPNADGISFIASADLPVDGSLVTKNQVVMRGSYYGGISLYDTPSHVIVAQNTISGDGSYALQVSTAVSQTPATAVANEFIDNSVDQFGATNSDIFLDINATETVLCHQRGSLIDNGSDTKKETGCRWSGH